MRQIVFLKIKKRRAFLTPFSLLKKRIIETKLFGN